VAAIDQVLGPARWCAHCARPLADSPDDVFCSESCQRDWRATAGTLRLAPAAPPVAVSDPAELLDRVAEFLGRFSVFPDQHCAPTLALWYAHTHAVQHFYTTPRLILDSAEPGSGKTRVLVWAIT
jgi:hypothetical protein